MIDLDRDDYSEDDFTPGAKVRYRKLSGYIIAQRRPIECLSVCRCGNCNGSIEEETSTAKSVINHDDNSVELVTHDGARHILVAASGDACA